MSESYQAKTLLRQPNFRRLFAAALVSLTGTELGKLALPVIAVLVLGVGPSEVGLLGALASVAFLLIGLPAGAWMDRTRRRAVMIAADLVRAALFLTVPLAWWLGVLTIYQLYVVVFCAGIATVFFDVAVMSFIPELVGRDRLIEANGALGGMTATSEIVGLSMGGLIIQVITAPVAVLIDVLSFGWSAFWTARISEPGTVAPTTGAPGLLSQVGEGVRYVARHPILRTIAIEGAIINLGTQMCLTIFPVLFLRDLGLSVGVMGIYLATGSAGVLIGSLTARRVADRLGNGRALWIVGAIALPATLSIPLVENGWLLPVTGLAWALTMYRIGLNTVLKVSFRQRITPERLLGRMNATFRFLLTGALAVGSALGGLLGEVATPRTAVCVGAMSVGTSWLIIYFSPLRQLRSLG